MRTLTLLGITGALLAGCAANSTGTHGDSGRDARDVASGTDATGTDDSVDSGSVEDATGTSDTGASDGADAGTDTAIADTGTSDVIPMDATANDVVDVLAPPDVSNDTGVDARPDVVALPDIVDVPSDVCVPSTEVCNGLDDDCNGVTDESGCPGHLLISEIVPTPSASEFIEIFNPTTAPVALDNIYLTDSQLYARVFASSGAPTIPAADFVARFPTGAVIQPGEYQTIATGNPAGWGGPYNNACPTYYVQPAGMVGTCTASRAMGPVPGVPTSIGTTATLTNGGESITLFLWDGASDIVADLDYVYYGAPAADGSNPPVDKSMLLVDGPDPDAQPTGYRLDTPASNQERAPLPAFSAAAIRCDNTEGTEVLNGGNGITGHNETSENLGTTWTTTTPTVAGDAGFAPTINASPNAANPCLVR